jgi:hypothetical protein
MESGQPIIERNFNSAFYREVMTGEGRVSRVIGYE